MEHLVQVLPCSKKDLGSNPGLVSFFKGSGCPLFAGRVLSGYSGLFPESKNVIVSLTDISELPGKSVILHVYLSCVSLCCSATVWQSAQVVPFLSSNDHWRKAVCPSRSCKDKQLNGK